jgi:hypothetical protein
MINIWPLGIHFQGHILAGGNVNSLGQRHGRLPTASGIIKIQASPNIKVNVRFRIVVITMLGSVPVSRSPGRRSRLRRRRRRSRGINRGRTVSNEQSASALKE